MLWNVGEMKEYSAGWKGKLALSEAVKDRSSSISSQLPYQNMVCLAVVMFATPTAHSFPSALSCARVVPSVSMDRCPDCHSLPSAVWWC